MMIIFTSIGTFFSSNFFIKSISNMIFKVKQKPQNKEKRATKQDKTSKELLKDTILKLDTKYQPVKISFLEIFCNPILRVILYPLKCCLKSLYKDLNIYTRCEDKLTDQLEVTNLLSKVNNSHNLLKHLYTHNYK